MVRQLLVRGMLVGAAGAALAFAFAYLFGEPSINAAIAFEDSHSAHSAPGAELVSRWVQSTLGLGVALLLYGGALGGIFAVAFGFAYGRLGALSARATSVVVAAIGFVAVFAVPFLKYPANPPAVGSEDTVGQRSTLWVLMVVISVLSAIAGVMLARSLVPRLGGWSAILAGVATFVVLVAVAGAVLPGTHEMPEAFPANDLWRFRLSSAGTQLVFWTTMGLLFGALSERRSRSKAEAEAEHAAASR